MSPSPSLISLTRQSLSQLLHRYSASLGRGGDSRHLSALQTGLGQIQTLQAKLESRCLKVAVFGLVSRGKSAVINALMGNSLLATGPIHGVTRWPRSLYWPVPLAGQPGQPAWQIELIDTPGLDEIDGNIQADMAQTVASQADLILFVVAGDITQAEYLALVDLWRQHKPLLLVFNKIDLYPAIDQATIAAQLRQLQQQLGEREGPPAITDGVVMVAASPAPWPVRVEWPDGSRQETWETPAPQIEPLRQALVTLVEQEGAALIALNTLNTARQVEGALVSHLSQIHGPQADAIIWRFARYKALAVALNPIVGLDLAAGVLADLAMIRQLAQVYGFSLSGRQVAHLWRAIIKSSGALLLSELGSGLLGAGKTTAALFSLIDSASGVTALTGAMMAQASTAGYGAYTVGKAAKIYLEQGCSWGPEGISTTLTRVLHRTDQSTTLARLRQEIQGSLAVGQTSR
ncbi:MAG: GTP-binding protein [Cyanobacteria bacterium REEB459]|nr:GTP-binding protein [Cyanobacteria bacterium REEB459]